MPIHKCSCNLIDIALTTGMELKKYEQFSASSPGLNPDSEEIYAPLSPSLSPQAQSLNGERIRDTRGIRQIGVSEMGRMKFESYGMS